MTLQKPPGHGESFRRQVFPNFGRWVYTTGAGSTLNFIEYDTTKAINKKIMTKGMPLNNDIVGVSASFSCVITIDYDAPSPVLNLYQINSVTGTI